MKCEQGKYILKINKELIIFYVNINAIFDSYIALNLEIGKRGELWTKYDGTHRFIDLILLSTILNLFADTFFPYIYPEKAL